MENKIGKIFRRVAQIAGFFIMPGLFTSTFFGLRDLTVAIASNDFQIQELMGQIILVAVMSVGAILFGRVFCGYLCSFGALGDFVWFLTRKIHPKYHCVPQKLDQIFKWIKYLILIGLFLGVWVFAIFSYDAMNSPWTVFGMFTTIGKFPSLTYLVSVGGLLLLGIIIASAFVERFFCRYLCPLGAYLSIISSIRIFKVKKPRDNCKGCSLCTQKCPMGLSLGNRDQVDTGECINCNICVAHCPKKNAHTNIKEWIAYPVAVILILGLSFGGPMIVKQFQGNSEVTNTSTTKGIYKDGTYEGTGTGFRGEIRVSVIVKNGNISKIEVLSQQEDGEYFEKAYSKVINEIIQQQKTDVDGASGATFSSNGIMEAVANALERAVDQTTGDLTDNDTSLNDTSENDTSLNDTSENDTTTDDTIENDILTGSYTDGTYEGTGKGFKGEVKVQVIVESGKISKINLVSQDDDEAFFAPAWEEVTASIIARQNPQVDGTSGATFSSNGIMEAVANALSVEFSNPTSEGGRHKGQNGKRP